MKWLVFAASLFFFPWLGRAARTRPTLKRALAFQVGFLPFLNIDINLISFESYRGDTRGLEVSLVDFVALSLFSSLDASETERQWRALRWFYLAVAIGSIYVAPNPLFACFGVWKILRLYRLCGTVARAGRSRALVSSLVQGLAAGVVFAAATALKQRYINGAVQTTGPFEHQNGLGMTANLVFPMVLALTLSAKATRVVRLALAGCAISVVLSLSRGSMSLFPIVALAVFAVSMKWRPSGKKWWWLAGGVLVGLLGLLKSYDTIVTRFTSAPDASAHARHLFKDAAALMLQDHPFGIGLNQYSFVQSHDGYAERLGIDPGDKDGIVHNIYWLTAAELGYLGILAFILLHARILWDAIRRAREHRNTFEGDLLVGIAVALSATFAQSALEWALRITPIGQVMWILCGLVMGLSRRPRSHPAVASSPSGKPLESQRGTAPCFETRQSPLHTRKGLHFEPMSSGAGFAQSKPNLARSLSVGTYELPPRSHHRIAVARVRYHRRHRERHRR